MAPKRSTWFPGRPKGLRGVAVKYAEQALVKRYRPEVARILAAMERVFKTKIVFISDRSDVGTCILSDKPAVIKAQVRKLGLELGLKISPSDMIVDVAARLRGR